MDKITSITQVININYETKEVTQGMFINAVVNGKEHTQTTVTTSPLEEDKEEIEEDKRGVNVDININSAEDKRGVNVVVSINSVEGLENESKIIAKEIYKSLSKFYKV